jgi:hypothetical protein
MDIKNCDFFLLTVKGEQGSKVRHPNFGSAKKEATRLAKKLNHEVFICGVVASVKPVVTVTETELHVR